MSNIRYESELYLPMCSWLEQFLRDKYSRQDCQVIVCDTSQVYLDSVLDKYNVLADFPQVVGLQIQIDVLGIVKWENKSEIVFIEAKKDSLTLKDLGQLWAYCKLCNPADAYLLSPAGLGGLNKILINMKREDMLDFGDGNTVKKIKVAKWDILRNEIDNHEIVPKL